MTKSQQKALVRDAERYRFLRSKASRDHQGHTQRALGVEILDWGRNLGATNSFWSSLQVSGRDMDRAVDSAMRRHQVKELAKWQRMP